MLALRILVFLTGTGMVALTLASVVKTFVLPRAAPDKITRFIFISLRTLLNLRLKTVRTYREHDQILAYYAPVGLMLLLPCWYLIVWGGYTLMFWALGSTSWYVALRDSGSSLLTLGFEGVPGLSMSLLAFSEATIGLGLIALLIAYLPTIYAAFSRREAAVTLLEVRAGDPPSALEMLRRYHRIHGLDRLSEEWQRWEAWFADVQESHSSLAALVFFRSPQASHSWVTAAGAVLDTASLSLSILDRPTDAQAALCVRAGYLALRSIADYFRIEYDPRPKPGDPISIRREEFEQLMDALASEGVALVANRDQAWRDYAGWRVNYDTVLLALAGLTSAPFAPWSSDRSTRLMVPPLFPK